MATLAGEQIAVKIDGQELSDLYQGMALEVELDDELAAMCRIALPLSQAMDGTWSLLDDARLQVWKQITVQAGFGDGLEDIFSGYITQVRPDFPSDAGSCRLEIFAIDGSVLLDREDKLKDWPDKTDSDIASEIFESYGLTAQVDATDVTHESDVSTVLQRESDMQFLRRLALRNGFECFVDGDTGYFRAPVLDDEPQPVLAAHFGEDTNLRTISFEVNALSPANVTMTQIDRSTKDILQAVVSTGDRRALGQVASAGLLQGGVTAAQVQVARAVATGSPEMTALCQGLVNRGDWFVTGTGEISANAYGHVLKPRATVTIKGVGEPYSGLYYVTHVSHVFSTDGYVQRFKVVRNGLKPTGSEDFGGGAGGLL
jgi:phage protein D